jgi:hypothetical protein
MKGIAIIFCLIILSSSSSVLILQSSTTSTTVVSPAKSTVVVATAYNSLKSNFAGAGVGWIQKSPVARYYTIYQSLFYSSCIGAANLSITADVSFTAYLDGVKIGNGSKYTQLYKYPLKITCGNHNLTIWVYSSTVTSAVTFAIYQDQSNCYNCILTGYWNEYTCACQCIDSLYGCKCPSPKTWRGYPTCGCRCPNIILRPPILIGAAAAAAPAAPAAPAATSAAALDLRLFYCLYPRYYSEYTCSCQCHYQYCPYRYYFDPTNCRCIAIITWANDRFPIYYLTY